MTPPALHVIKTQNTNLPTSLFLICFDLHEPGQNYDDLKDILTNLGAEWIQGSTWVLKAQSTPFSIRKKLEKALDENDVVLVVRFDAFSDRNLPVEISKL